MLEERFGALRNVWRAARRLLLLMNMKRFLLILLALAVFGVPEMDAQKFARCQSCTRDGRGKIVRSAKVKKEFVRQNPCPSRVVGTSHLRGCSGYQVDHVVPLACGGRDVAQNLQWLTVAAHRAKTKADATCSK